MKTEYIDLKNVKHKVEHISPNALDKSSKEQIAEALWGALSKPRKVPA